MRYIDADALLNNLPDDLPYKASVKRVLIQAPTEDVVEVRHGEWKDRYNGKYANPTYDCSVCDKEAPCRIARNELGNPYLKEVLSPYCPNCGAKMKGEGK